MPAGLWSKTQFTYVEVKTSRQISRARIHVERSIGYLKRYKILKKQSAAENVAISFKNNVCSGHDNKLGRCFSEGVGQGF